MNYRSGIRGDLELIAGMVGANSRVLDVGCGDGTLLGHLKSERQVDGRGIELSMDGVRECVSNGLSVGHAHLRHLCPFPRNLETILGNFKKVLIPELNLGQLNTIIRSEFLLEAETLNKVKGRPFTVTEIEAKIRELL